MSKTDGLFGLGAVGLIADGLFNSFHLVFEASSLLYPIASIVSSSIVPETGLGFVTADMIQWLVVVLAIMYVCNLLLRLKERYENGAYDS